MTVAEALRARLASLPGVIAFVEDRIYPIVAPMPEGYDGDNSVVKDFLVYRLDSWDRERTMSGLGVQVTNWSVIAASQSYLRAHQLMDQVMAGLDGQRGIWGASETDPGLQVQICTAVSANDDQDTDTGLLGVIATFEVKTQ